MKSYLLRVYILNGGFILSSTNIVDLIDCEHFPMFCHRVIFLILLLIWEVASSTICYYPDGTVASNDQPCLPNAEESFCCGATAVCASTKVCLEGPNSPINVYSPYSRGSCTDKTWTSPECPSFCMDSKFGTSPSPYRPTYSLSLLRCETIESHGGAMLEYCGADRYCCATPQDCCQSKSTFNLGDSSNVTTIGAAAASTKPTTPPTQTPTAASLDGLTRPAEIGTIIGTVFAGITVIGLIITCLVKMGFITIPWKKP